MTLVRDKKQRGVQNKKEIGEAASGIGAPSRQVQAAIKGDGDETVEESEENLDDSDSPKIHC